MDLLRRAILRLERKGRFDRLHDRIYLKLIYWCHMGRGLNLKNPRTFNEKLQWLKLYDRNPEHTKMVDKYEAKLYAAQQIGEKYIIPTLGVWDKFEDINFDSLPDRFVLKCTHDSGGLVICHDKSKLDKQAARNKINRCLEQNYYYRGREWPYKNVKPRVIAEEYMEDGSVRGLRDYKFFCFNGEPKILYISQGLEDHNTASISFYDDQGRPMPFRRSDFRPIDENIKLPVHFDKMKQIAKKLAEAIGSAFVRIDLYSVQEKIYFSEITFFPCTGMLPFDPQEWDDRLGEWIDLSRLNG